MSASLENLLVGMGPIAVAVSGGIDSLTLDGAPVDLAFLLVAPEASGADHLKALARIARVLREPRIVAKLRATRDAAGLYGVLTQQPTSNAA